MAVLACVFATSTASAGGYVAPVVSVDDVAPAPMIAAQSQLENAQSFSWTGPYLGAAIGYSDLKLKRRVPVEHPAEVIEHPAITEEVIVPAVTEEVVIPAETRDVEIPPVTEEREIPPVTRDVVHPPITREVEIPPITEEREIVVEHPPVTEERPVIDKIWKPTDPKDQYPGCNHGNNTCPVPVPGSGEWNDKGQWTGDWERGEVGRETVTIRDAWTETSTETVIVTPGRTETEIVRDSWTETVVVTPGRVETVIVEPGRTETEIVSAARTETIIVEPERRETRIISEAWTEVVRAAYASTFVQEMKESANTFGVFTGYRYQFSNKAVVGVEANYARTNGVRTSFEQESHRFDLKTVSIEAQLGYAYARFLPYIAAGYVKTSGDDGWLAAAGVDYALTDNVILGIKYTRHDYDNLQGWKATNDTISARVGWKF